MKHGKICRKRGGEVGDITIKYLVVLFNGDMLISLHRPRTWKRLLFYLGSGGYTDAVIEAIYFSGDGICLGAKGYIYKNGIDKLPLEGSFSGEDIIRDVARLTIFELVEE